MGNLQIDRSVLKNKGSCQNLDLHTNKYHFNQAGCDSLRLDETASRQLSYLNIRSRFTVVPSLI